MTTMWLWLMSAFVLLLMGDTKLCKGNWQHVSLGTLQYLGQWQAICLVLSVHGHSAFLGAHT